MDNNNNNNNNNKNDEKSYIFTTNNIPYRNDNLNYIIKPHLQEFYQQQFIAQQQQQQYNQSNNNSSFKSQESKSESQLPNNNSINQPAQQPHHLINILDPFNKDKIILKKKKDGLFSSEQPLESVIPPNIIPASRVYYLLDEINHFYSKEFFIYDRLIIFTSILMGLSLFTAALFINTDDDNGDLSAQFLVPMSMSMVFLIFYCVSAFCRYYSCPKHMNEFCNSLNIRYSGNLTFKYFKGSWTRGEKITILYPRIHINPIVYVYVNENDINHNNNNLNNNNNNLNNNSNLNNNNIQLNNNNNSNSNNSSKNDPTNNNSIFNSNFNNSINHNNNNRNNLNSINDILN